MQLGKKSRGADLLGAAVSQDAAPVAAAASSSRPSATVVAKPATSAADALPASETEAVHVIVKERVSVTATRDGSLSSLEVKGDLELRITDPALAKVKLQISQGVALGDELQYKTHPHVDKAAWASGHAITLRDPSKPFPVNQNLAVLRWRLASKDESLVPLSISCWPSVSGDGSGDVNVEYELENTNLELDNVVIAIPVPGEVTSAEPSAGDYQWDEDAGTLYWNIGTVNSSTSTSGTLEFSIGSEADSADVFFPVQVDFSSSSAESSTGGGRTLTETGVDSIVSTANGPGSSQPVQWSKQSVLLAEGYQIV